jgi:hypothetical protein
MDIVKKSISFPDPLASFSEKKTDTYGLSIAQLISSEWFGSGGMITTGCEFMNRKEYVRKKRLFVRGEHDAGYFKNQMAKGDNDLDYINIDWSNINWAEKFCRIVSNGLSDKNYKLDVRATDKLSAMKKEKQQDYYLKEMKSKNMLLKAKKELGIDLMPKGFVPEDEEEMNLYMEIKERPRIEIAEEILIDYVFNTNEWSFLEGQFAKDLVDVGLIVGRIYTNKSDGVKLAYVDPENYIHSRVTRNDFFDKTYEGVVETVSISDIKRESGFDDATLRKIAKSYGASNSNMGIDYSNCKIEDIINYKVNVCRFAYKTTKTITYKKKIRNGETVKASRKDDNYIAPDRKDVGMISNTFDVWFEGNHIVGTNYIYGYKECENQYDDVMNKAMSPFVTFAYDIYENRLRSFTDNIEAASRQLQKISLKIQQLVSELTPDLKEVDLDMLAELDDGKGGVKKEVWQTALSLMSAKGVIFKKRIDMGETGLKDAPAVRPYGSQQGSALTILLNTWAQYYNFIRENTGVNPARDGSMSADSLVGVNQMAELASNTVTANIVDTAVLFKKKLSENISTRIHSIFSYSEAKKIKEIYANVVGRQMIDFMEILKDRHLHEFGFTFEMNPTSQEIKDFADLLTLAVQEQTIDVEVAYQAKQIAKVNIKKATEYLMYHRRKRIKQRQEEEVMLAQEKSKDDTMSAQAAEQAKLQSYQAKKEIDFNFEKRMAQVRAMEAQAIQQVSLPKEQREFEQEVYLKKIESMTSLNKEEFKESRKDDRTKIQASQQSKMVEQRQKESSAIDFEDEEDWFMN